MPAQSYPDALVLPDGGTTKDTAPLRIALLGYRSHPYSGGQGVYLKYLSRALARQGHKVEVISGEPYPTLDKEVALKKLPGLNLFEAPNHLTALKLRHLLSLTDFFEWASMASGGFPEPFTFGRRLKRFLDNNPDRYDVIHDNQSLCYALLRIQHKYPLVATIHHPITSDRDIALENSDDPGERLLIRRWHNFLKMQIKVAKKLSSIITVSNNSKRDLLKDFGLEEDRIQVVYNGIDTNDFYPLKCCNESSLKNPLQLITTASADQPLKGTRHLLRAMAELREDFPQLRLNIIGALRPDGENEKLIKALKLQSHISQHSDLSTQQIRSLYAESSIAVVPSDYEGFGLPAGEAMACGLPVVSTDGGALPEVLGRAGLVVPAKDPLALASAIRRLILDPKLRANLAGQGLERVRTVFDWDRAATETTAIYREQIANHKSASHKVYAT